MKPNLLPDLLMCLLVAACLLIVVAGLRSAIRRTAWPQAEQQSYFRRSLALLVLWVLGLSALSLLGLFKDFSSLPPRPMVLVLIAGIGLLALSYTQRFRALLQAMPVHWLVCLQSFRIGVEALLLLSFQRGLLPVQMSWEGYNYDVLSGILALPAGYLMSRYRHLRHPVGIAYNIIGLILLVNIMVISVLSMPTPFRYFMDGPTNTIVGEFPFILLPGVLVVLALSGHILSLRQLYLLSKLNSNKGRLQESALVQL